MHHRGFVAHMTGALVALLLADPGTSACLDALRPGSGTLAERAQVMVKACGPLITSTSCREAFGRFHDIGHRPVPLRTLVDACRPAYCRFDPEIPCNAPPARLPGDLWNQWSLLQRAIWRHDAAVDAEAITKRFERGTWWSWDAAEEPVGSMALHVQDEKTVLLVARLGPRERRWTLPATPRQEDYASIQAWLEREVRTSGRVDLAAEPAIQFAHVKLLMAAVFAAGQPSIAFRVLR